MDMQESGRASENRVRAAARRPKGAGRAPTASIEARRTHHGGKGPR